MLQWLAEQWNDIKGNAKWAIVLLILSAMTLAATMLTDGLVLWKQLTLLAIFILMFAWAVFMTAARIYAVRVPTTAIPSLETLETAEATSGLEIRFSADMPYRLEEHPYTHHRIGIYNRSGTSAEHDVAVNLKAISPRPRSQIFSRDFPCHYNNFNLNPKEEQLIEVVRSWVSADGQLMIGRIDKLDRAIPIEKDECWHLEISVTSASRPAQVATFVLRPSSSPIVFDRLM